MKSNQDKQQNREQRTPGGVVGCLTRDLLSWVSGCWSVSGVLLVLIVFGACGVVSAQNQGSGEGRNARGGNRGGQGSPGSPSPSLSFDAASRLKEASAAAAASGGSLGRPASTLIPRVYLLTPGDRIEVKMFQQPEITTMDRVSTDGTINLPLLGSVKLAGMTEDQAKNHVQGLYAADYYVNPQVTLTVVEKGKWRFSVTGQVLRQDTFEATNGEPLDLLEAVSRAGGFNGKAKTSRVVIKRREANQEVVIVKDADAMLRGKEAPFEIRPGDVIFVDERIF